MLSPLISTWKDTINTLVSITHNTITANQKGLNYQWLDCENNLQPIPGASSRSYAPFKKGVFAVLIYYGDCADTSLCYEMDYVGIVDAGISNDISVNPNPNNGKFTIELNNSAIRRLDILNIQGQSIFRNEFEDENRVDIQQNLEPGLYLLRIECSKGILSKKIIIE